PHATPERSTFFDTRRYLSRSNSSTTPPLGTPPAFASSPPADHRARGRSGGQASPKELGRDRGVRGATRTLHDLADERVDGAILASPELGDGPGILGDDLLDDRLEGRRVRDLPEPARLDDVRDRRTGGERLRERALRPGRGDVPGREEHQQVRQVLRRDAGVDELGPRLVQQA